MFRNTLSGDAQKTLALLGKSRLFDQSYLAGGSALALRLGHRISIDFDFFTPKKFSPVKLADKISQVGRFEVKYAKGISLIGFFEGIQLSCFQYDYPLLEPPDPELNISIAAVSDIAAMKLVAISDRSTKKDYVDLYFIHRAGVTFERMIEFYDRKYKLFSENKLTLIKSLTYTGPAEETAMPEMLMPVDWGEVKEFLSRESLLLAKKYLE